MNSSNEVPERAAFEHWFSDEGKSPKAIQRSGDGYLLMQASSSWLAWQAAWAARASLPQPSAEPVNCECGKCEWRDFYEGSRQTHHICANCGFKVPLAPTVPAIPRTSAEAVMVGVRRLIPDAECVQSKCGCVTTGCWDACSLRQHPVILATQLTPAVRQIVGGTGISAADQAFFDFWYSHMVSDQMTGAVADVSHAAARYIWDAAQAKQQGEDQ